MQEELKRREKQRSFNDGAAAAPPDDQGGMQQEAAQQKQQQPRPGRQTVAPEERLMAAVGARRREWQMVYSHLYMNGVGLGDLVERLLQCGITLNDYHSLAVEVSVL